MGANDFQKLIPVLGKKSLFTHRLQIIDEIASRNILYRGTPRIKYFTHPDFVRRPEYSSDLGYEIISQKTGGSVSMRLEPRYHFRRDILAGFYRHRTFYGVVRIIVNQ